MKRSEKGVLGIILAATLMVGATAVVSANGGTLVDKDSFASKGKIQVKENETDPDPAIVIDSADLVTLANATNELNTQFTDSLAAAVNNIGSVPKTDRVAAGAQFSDILSAITNSQAIDSSESVYVLPNGTVTDDSTAEGVVETQIAGATADNLTAGTAAWVDGQYIVGTGVDNNSYYNRGYTEGVAKVDNGTVTYITHSHTESGCSLGQCNISANIVSSQVRSDGRTYYTYSITHSLCGSASTSYTTSNASYQPSPSSHSFYTCGYSDGEIIGAEITFN